MLKKNFIYSIILLFTLSSSIIYSQVIWSCDTDNSVLPIAKNMAKTFQSPDYVSILSNANIHVFLHIIRSSNGTGGFTSSEVNTAFSIAISDYASLGIALTSIGTDYIDDDNFANFSESKYSSLVSTNNHEYAIDIYFVKNIDYGKANGIPSTELVIGNTYVGTSVLSHEIGHCLGLFHTHSGRGCNDFANCAEAIDGSNCNTCGDLVCDTPADPCLSGNVNSSCIYTGPAEFDPDVDNIMSYAPPTCLSNLTQGQNDRVFSMIESNTVLLKVLSPTLAGTIQVDEYWYNTINLTGNVYVPSSKSLTIKSGATVNLNGYNLLLSGGNIIIESGANVNYLATLKNSSNTLLGYYGTVQSSINDAISYYTVELRSMTYNENISLTDKDYVTLKGAGIGSTIINGNITITNSYGALVEDMSMGYSKTITVNGGYRPKLLNISATSGSSMISSYSVDGIIIEDLNYISSAAQAYSWGFYNSTNFNISNNTIEGYEFGIYATSGSNIYMSGGYFCNNMLDLYAATIDSYLYATLSYLSYDGAYSGVNCSVGTILGYCGSGSTIKDNSSQLAKNAAEPFDNLKEANLAFRALLLDENIRKSSKLTENSKNKVNGVIAQYKNVLLKNLSKEEINEALRKLSVCYRMLDEETVYADYVADLISNKKVPSEMKRFLIPNLVSKGSYNEAINLIDEISAYQDITLDLKYELQYEKGTIQKYYLNEIDLSEKVFLDLYKTAGDHILAQYAKAQLDDQSGLDEGNKPIAGDNTDQSNGFAVSSYPNPFNPTATIEYQLPKDGFVNLVVYNTLGQVVAELVNESQTSGKYSVQFNASNLPSGIYFYKIEVGTSSSSAANYSKSMKMILLK